MTTVIITRRTADGWRDRYRPYGVIVDDKHRADLWPGEESRIEVCPGQMEVYLKIDWCTSRPLQVNLKAGSENRFVCRSRSLLTAIYGVTLGRHNYIQVEAQDKAAD